MSDIDFGNLQKSQKVDWRLFLIFFLAFIKIQTPLGTILLTELILLTIGLLYLSSREFFRGSSPEIISKLRLLLLLLLFWFISSISVDVYRNVVIGELLKGAGRLIILGLNILATFALIRGDVRRFLTVVTAFSCAGIIGYIAFPTPYGSQSPWKFGYGMALTILILALFSFSLPKRFSFMLLSLLGLATYSLLNNYRSLAFISFISLFLWSINRTNWAKASFKTLPHSTNWPLPKNLLITVGLVMLIGVSYPKLATSGVLGKQATDGYFSQSQGSLSPLVGARQEIFYTLSQIASSPIIGTGTPGNASTLVLERAISIANQYGYQIRSQGTFASNLSDNRLPLHSFFFGSWVQVGFGAVPFWIYLLILTWRSFECSLRCYSQITIITIFFSVRFFFDFIGSPFGLYERLHIALLVSGIFIHVSSHGRNQQLLTKRI